ncbi:MAG: hypothetical protein U1F39_12780 [Steroidobacteraceae bacterium]
MRKSQLIAAALACGAAVLAQSGVAAQPAGMEQRPTGGSFTAPPPDRVPVCTRATLQAAVDSYLEAQRTGNPRKLSLAGNVRVLQDMAPIEASQGLWNKPLVIAATNSVLDAVRCKTFTEVVVTEGTPYVIGTRLYVDEGRITRIDSLVTTKGDWLFNANNYAHVMKMEDWGVLPIAQRTRAQDMINGANAYLDAFQDKHLEQPWGTPCERTEGGAYTNVKGDPNSTCKVGIPNGVLYIVNRDYLVDEEKGVVQVYCRFGNSTNGMPDSHMFRYVNGKYRYVHTISVSAAKNSPQIGDYWPAGEQPVK